jgi:hypothetical protein
MGTKIDLHARSGRDGGYRGQLPLDEALPHPIRIDARGLGPCHPMFLVRLRVFIDWHLSVGHEVTLERPRDPATATQLASLGVLDGLPLAVVGEPAGDGGVGSAGAVLPLRQLANPLDVEEAAMQATEVLQQQVAELAVWGDPVHMALSELCGNALQHGRGPLPAYVAADRVDGEHRLFRLAIADLGIGVPEHIRGRHPEWHDDTAAITKALERGVTGTKDPHRGNGFAEVFDEALDRLLVRTLSSVTVDIRSGKGGVVIDLVDGRQDASAAQIDGPRRGTWITYTVTSI